jgi:hypothetical protein
MIHLLHQEAFVKLFDDVDDVAEAGSFSAA